jgi:hypothetical protein
VDLGEVDDDDDDEMVDDVDDDDCARGKSIAAFVGARLAGSGCYAHNDQTHQTHIQLTGMLSSALGFLGLTMPAEGVCAVVGVAVVLVTALISASNCCDKRFSVFFKSAFDDAGGDVGVGVLAAVVGAGVVDFGVTNDATANRI